MFGIFKKPVHVKVPKIEIYEVTLNLNYGENMGYYNTAYATTINGYLELREKVNQQIAKRSLCLNSSDKFLTIDIGILFEDFVTIRKSLITSMNMETKQIKISPNELLDFENSYMIYNKSSKND